jgi:hypothetical protein
MLSVLVYRILNVQIVYSVQMNCTDSNYRERDSYVECVTVQHIKCADSVQCAAELY